MMKRIVKPLKNLIKRILFRQKITQAKIVSLAPNQLLEGRTALITGGTSGIGKSIAISFLNAGANVVITGRNQTKVDTVCEEIMKTYPGCNLWGVEMDNKNISTLKETFDKILRIIGPNEISILVNNAGVNGGDFTNCTEKEWDKVMDTNMKGPFFLTNIVANYMVNHQIKGNILNVASSSSLRPGTTAYTLSKWGMRGFTVGLAKILIDNGIVVNGIAPGPTDTPMLKSPKDKNISLPNNPSGRFVMPEEVGNLAVFLTSDMGRMIIGDIVYITGGAGTITVDDISY